MCVCVCVCVCVTLQAVEIRDLIIRCVSQMVLARVDNVKSGWKSMFMVFTTAAGTVTHAHSHRRRGTCVCAHVYALSRARTHTHTASFVSPEPYSGLSDLIALHSRGPARSVG